MLNIADRMNSLEVETLTGSDEVAIRTLAAVRELVPKIRAAANEIEQRRRLPLRCALCGICSERACFECRCHAHGAALSWIFFHSCK
jgi:hypothetical protein